MSDWRLWSVLAAVALWALRVWWTFPRTPAPAPARTPIDGLVPEPTRYEYKIMLMLVTGEKDAAYLTGTLFPEYRTLRGQVPEKGKRYMKALLHPMIARGWVVRVDKGNPGFWVYAIQPAGYEALKRVEVPPVQVWPVEHARPPRR